MGSRKNRLLLLQLLVFWSQLNVPSAFHSRQNYDGTKAIPSPRDDDPPFHSSTSYSKLKRDEFLKRFEAERELIIEEEELMAIGGHLELTPQELKVHQIFMKLKLAEMEYGSRYPEEHAPGMHFFHAKELIEKSRVFQLLQKMPKGAILHVHNSASVSSAWVASNLTRTPRMLSCINEAGTLILTFQPNQDKHQCMTAYKLVQQERAEARSEHEYDMMLERNMNLYARQPGIEYNTVDKVWSRFQNLFTTISDLLRYLPTFRAFHWRMMEEMYEDRVMYAEIRLRIKTLFDEDGNELTVQQTVEELIDLEKRFKDIHPDFFGIKVIYTTKRSKPQEYIRQQFQIFKELHYLYPDFVIGFDLVGSEDKGNSLLFFIDVLRDLPNSAKFFFHAGETKWTGTKADLNLLDAILMNTTRIGHGYTLLKHPILRRAVQTRDIALEVSPLSNQVLNLVWDLRNHPAGFFMAEDVPMVISNDDPGFWGAKGLSYDMYYAIMSFAPCNAGLKTLKNIIWNSIKYSALNENEKRVAYEQLSSQWVRFLERVLEGEIV